MWSCMQDRPAAALGCEGSPGRGAAAVHVPGHGRIHPNRRVRGAGQGAAPLPGLHGKARLSRPGCMSDGCLQPMDAPAHGCLAQPSSGLRASLSCCIFAVLFRDRPALWLMHLQAAASTLGFPCATHVQRCSARLQPSLQARHPCLACNQDTWAQAAGADTHLRIISLSWAAGDSNARIYT